MREEREVLYVKQMFSPLPGIASTPQIQRPPIPGVETPHRKMRARDCRRAL